MLNAIWTITVNEILRLKNQTIYLMLAILLASGILSEFFNLRISLIVIVHITLSKFTGLVGVFPSSQIITFLAVIG